MADNETNKQGSPVKPERVYLGVIKTRDTLNNTEAYIVSSPHIKARGWNSIAAIGSLVLRHDQEILAAIKALDQAGISSEIKG